MKDNWFENESDDDNLHVEESGSETENNDSQKAEEIDLENLEIGDPNEKYTQKRSYSSRSNMVWSSTPSYSSATKRYSNVIGTPGLTDFTKNVVSIEDAFLCFISEEMLKKILLYSIIERNANRASDDSFEEITMIELKAFIGLLRIAGLLGKSRKSIKSLWNRSPLESPIFRATMSRNRFETIVSCLRFDDKTTRDERKQTNR